MPEVTSKTVRNEAVLTELVDLGLTLARDLHGRAIAAKDDDAAGTLALAFHRVSRCIRQTLALDARLEREAKLAAREAVRDAEREFINRRDRKRAQVRRAITPLIWNEAEGEDAEALEEELQALVYEASQDEGFLDAPIETCIEHIREGLGLAPAKTDDGEGETADTEIPDVVIWRDSG